MSTPLRQDITKLAEENPALRELLAATEGTGKFAVFPYRRMVDRLAHASLTLDAAVRIASKRGAEFWFEVGAVKNITVKDYEEYYLGDSKLSGIIHLRGTLHVQPKGASWSAQFPVNHRMQIDEDPGGGLHFSAKGDDAVGKLLNMALFDYKVEDEIRRHLRDVPYVEYVDPRQREVTKDAKWASRMLAEGLRKTKLPTENQGMRRASPREFGLAAPHPAPVGGRYGRSRKFWQFKHHDTRNYVLIDSETGELVVPKSSAAFFRGQFDKFAKTAAMLTPQEFDSLRPRQRIWLGVKTSWVDMNGEAEFEVGRKTYSKKYDVYSIRLYPVIEGKPHKGGAKWTLFKRDNDYISLGHGGMGTIVKSYRLASKQASAVIEGDIFVSRWGYDQTNVDFYQVVGTTKTMVKLREVAKRVTRGRGEPQEYVMPVANKFTGPVMRKKLKEGWRGGPWVDLTSYSGASKWDGREVAQTGGAYGH